MSDNFLRLLSKNQFYIKLRNWRDAGTLDRNLVSKATKKGHKHRIGEHFSPKTNDKIPSIERNMHRGKKPTLTQRIKAKVTWRGLGIKSRTRPLIKRVDPIRQRYHNK